MEKYLYDGFGEFEKLNINFITDGIPLCYMKNYESHSIDAYKLIKGDTTHLGEKEKTKVCYKCSYNIICPGPRIDYVDLYGDRELKPFKKSPQAIIQRIKKEHNL